MPEEQSKYAGTMVVGLFGLVVAFAVTGSLVDDLVYPIAAVLGLAAFAFIAWWSQTHSILLGQPVRYRLPLLEWSAAAFFLAVGGALVPFVPPLVWIALVTCGAVLLGLALFRAQAVEAQSDTGKDPGE